MMNLLKLKINFRTSLIALIILIAIVIAYFYWRYSVLNPSTDNAYVNANVINISAQVSGPITKIYVENDKAVKKDQPLFDILPTQYQAAVDQAKAQKIQAENNVRRTAKLVKLGYAAQTLLDDANANLAAAQSALEQAELNLSFTHVTAPASGNLINFTLRVGNSLSAGNTGILFSIIEDQVWWVDANYKETQLERIRPGQKAIITLDLYPNKKFNGKVMAISDGSGSAFSLLPPENATGNWIKVTQRFPVKIMIDDLDPQYPLRLGASATVSVKTG
jgi:membrane fusion protein (multidrug efflux system)